MDKDTPAFPQSFAADGPFGGLTIRQYAAIKIMAGIMGSRNATMDRDDPRSFEQMFAQMAVEQADALLAELENDHG